MSAGKTTKELSREPVEDEESSKEKTGSSGEELELEEAEPATPPPKKKKGIETWSSNQKKHASAFKTPVAPKRPTKTP